MLPQNPRLLLVEDHDDTRELLTLVLTQENYDMACAPGVIKGLELASLHKFDVMIIDSQLDDGSGIELCRAIREYDHLTPIMFYSGCAYEKDKQEAFDAGAQNYLVKPVDVSLLVATLKNLLEDSKGIAAQGSQKFSGETCNHLINQQRVQSDNREGQVAGSCGQQ